MERKCGLGGQTLVCILASSWTSCVILGKSLYFSVHHLSYKTSPFFVDTVKILVTEIMYVNHLRFDTE